MPAGSQPLAFAELAFGGLLITSAITGESIGELLTKGVTAEGKKRLHAQKGGSAETLSPGSGSGGGLPSPSTGAGSGSGSSSNSFTPHLAPNPFKIQLPKAAPGGSSGTPYASRVSMSTLSQWEKQLENFYHKALTPKEKSELALLAQRNEHPGRSPRLVAP